ncbi:alpha,alpha-trehalose-phosphate synthase (UDP-forming) [Comamonas sp. NoAH]|uniref:alpha,alpha-trehalose-phosphate synthase (UDP-forming) n=1 Tax=Comamonas halotolerans TaxID=3041496 RepID=UPI0024E0E0C0|nr:trehalose-6-phosphate synthase [Comamonas sp. NoAH]
MKLIIVSNRVAHDATPQAGGLASAIQAALKSIRGTWIGWSGDISTLPLHKSGSLGSIDYEIFSLTEAEYAGYYLQYANEVLWPACHMRPTYVRWLDNAFQTYCAVNQKFAQVVANHASSKDIVWVHDYHLMMVASYLRSHKHTGPLGYFHHIPVPPPELIQSIPHHEQLLKSLLQYDLVGLQTAKDLENLRQHLLHMRSRSQFANLQVHAVSEREVWVQLGNRLTKFGAYPISIFTKELESIGTQSVDHPVRTEWARRLGQHPLVIGVDRLDYTKGLEQKLLAFDKYLHQHSHGAPAALLQIAPRSRSQVPAYQQLCSRIDALVEQIQDTHSRPGYCPIYYDHRVQNIETLAALYRLARVALVTPTKDGMNLVAKEYVAAQDPQDPGILVLSEFAGAAQELKQAILVNPFNVEQTAQAISQALSMPRDERIQRHQSMLKTLRAHNLHNWYEQFLEDLLTPRQTCSMEYITT